MGKPSMNEFYTDLAYSNLASEELFWEQVYRKFFSGFQKMQLTADDMKMQKVGIDRIVYLTSGQRVKIDEKKRRKAYNDFLLEYISVDTTNAPGWIEKELAIDFLAYAFMPTKTVYMLEWHSLRRAWKSNGRIWYDTYGSRCAENKNYNTYSVPVPIDVVLSAISNYSIVRL
jgi:hypothetical protein